LPLDFRLTAKNNNGKPMNARSKNLIQSNKNKKKWDKAYNRTTNTTTPTAFRF